jgi:hypothetical protein
VHQEKFTRGSFHLFKNIMMILCNQGLEHMNPLRPLEGKEGNTPLRGEYLHPMVSLDILS